MSVTDGVDKSGEEAAGADESREIFSSEDEEFS